MSTRITPFIKRMRTQGGTIYTFSSAVEDIGLNINERNNVVKISNFALLNIPAVKSQNLTPASANNYFNVDAINGAWFYDQGGSSIKDGRILIAESFQNYALNLETLLLSQTTYNATLSNTVSERVFWKWLKETGAIRFTSVDTSAGLKWIEEYDNLDSSVGYNSVVKCIGTVSAGNVRTDTFGTYNETYVLVPTSYGQTNVYFNQVEDENYYHGQVIDGGTVNISGRETYVQPHPDGLSYKAYYDIMNDSSTCSLYALQINNGASFVNGWWFTDPSSVAIANGYTQSYLIDSSRYIASGIYTNNLKYSGASSFTYKRSKVDCLSIIYDLDTLKVIYNSTDANFSFDSISLPPNSINNNFEFNAVLIYYSTYNSTMDVKLATNLLGILFLDAPSGNTSNITSSGILIPAITKLQSTAAGFGTSYSLRLNIKTDSLMDNTQAVIYDETTSAQTVAEDFIPVFQNLSLAVEILNQQASTVNYISEQYSLISDQHQQMLNDIQQLEQQVNAIGRDIVGEAGNLAMFSGADPALGGDPLIDSSIYMKSGNIGLFTNNPTYPVQIDKNLKTKEIFIENAIKDASGNVLLGYGSPLQIGASTNSRLINFYNGNITPAMTIDSSAYINMQLNVNGSLGITGDITVTGKINGITALSDFAYEVKQDASIALKTNFTYDLRQDASIALSTKRYGTSGIGAAARTILLGMKDASGSIGDILFIDTSVYYKPTATTWVVWNASIKTFG